MSHTFKNATQQDFNLLRQIQRRSKGYWGYSSEIMDIFMERYGLHPDMLQPDLVKILMKDNAPIGYYAFVLSETEPLYLDSFFIDPPYIGQGWGRVMWEACLQTAKALGATTFTLWSDPEADDFYRKMGCREIGAKQSVLMPNRYPMMFACDL